jgi:hypothetical protein
LRGFVFEVSEAFEEVSRLAPFESAFRWVGALGLWASPVGVSEDCAVAVLIGLSLREVTVVSFWCVHEVEGKASHAGGPGMPILFLGKRDPSEVVNIP